MAMPICKKATQHNSRHAKYLVCFYFADHTKNMNITMLIGSLREVLSD